MRLPAETVVSPENVLLPESTRLPEPDFTNAAPVPASEMTAVTVTVPVFTEIKESAASIQPRLGLRVMVLAKFNPPPLNTMAAALNVPGAIPNAASLVTLSCPAFTCTGPVMVDVPVMESVPNPSFTSDAPLA